jgi:tetratricopeptide (TPR) repeat protein
MNSRYIRRAALFIGLLVFIPLVFIQSRSPIPPIISSQQLIDDNLAQNRLMQALYQVEAAAVSSGWTAELARTAGNMWEQMGDLSQAVPYWEMSSRLNTADAALMSHLAEAYLVLQRWPEGADTLQRLLVVTPDDNWAHYTLGLLEAAFDPRDAKIHLRLAARNLSYRSVAYDLDASLSNTPVDSTMAMAAGFVLAQHELWPYAELAFKQAADLGAPFPEALAYTALARDKQGKDGQDAMNQALTFAPDNPQVLYLQGLHLRTCGDDLGSLSALLSAATLDSINPAYAAEVGAAYQLVDQLGEAETWLKTALSLSDNDPRFQALLDDFYAGLPTN